MSVTHDSTRLDETNKLGDLNKLELQSNKTSSCLDNDQSCSSQVIENINDQRSTRISTGSLICKKCNTFHSI